MWPVAAAIGVSGAAQGYMAKRAADKNANAMNQAAQTSADATERANAANIEAALQLRAGNLELAENARMRSIQWAQRANNQALQAIAPTADQEIGWGAEADLRRNAMIMGSPEDIRRQIESDPYYQWRYQQGLQAMDRSAVGPRGQGLGSGNALLAAQQYGQNMAGSEYDKALARLMEISLRGQAASRRKEAMHLGNAQNMQAAKTTGMNNVLRAGIGGNAGIADATQSNAMNSLAAQNQIAQAQMSAAMMQNNAQSNMYGGAINSAANAMMFGMYGPNPTVRPNTTLQDVGQSPQAQNSMYLTPYSQTNYGNYGYGNGAPQFGPYNL